jgi:hypothetical protein
MLSSALLIVPISVVACMFVMVCSMALYDDGVQRVLGIHEDNAAIFVAMSIAIMCLISAPAGGEARFLESPISMGVFRRYSPERPVDSQVSPSLSNRVSKE